MKNRHIVFITLLIFTLSACNNETLDKQIIGPEYLPMEVGKYITYACVKIEHDPFLEKSDTTHFWIRESCIKQTEEFDNITYQFIQEESNDSGQSWMFRKWINYHVYNFSFLRQEDDVLKSKLTTPLIERQSWDANGFNTLPFQRARALSLGDASRTFSNTVSIDLGDEEDILFTDLEKEVYAKGVGLVERSFQHLERQPGKYIDGNEYFQLFQDSNW